MMVTHMIIPQRLSVLLLFQEYARYGVGLISREH